MQYALDLIVKTTYKYMNSFHWKKIIEDSINDRLIITATTTEIFFALKAANGIPSKTSLGAMNIMKDASGICEWVLINIYSIYKKSINKWMIALGIDMTCNTNCSFTKVSKLYSLQEL